MDPFKSPIRIEFPLRGEWQAPTTPVKRVPSHGTNRMGMRYAFDFVQVNWNKPHKPFYDTSFARYFLSGVPLANCYCWGQPIYAPCEGEVIAVVDGIPERQTVHWVSDGALAIKNARTFNEYQDDFSQIAGNYLIVKHAPQVYLAFVHLQTNSHRCSCRSTVAKRRIPRKRRSLWQLHLASFALSSHGQRRHCPCQRLTLRLREV